MKLARVFDWAFLAKIGSAVLAMVGCSGGAAGSSAEPPPAPSGSAPAIDPAAVEAATGIKPEIDQSVVKVSYARNDVKVEVDAWPMPPFMGLTSWAGFMPGEKHGVPAMVMGDLVLFEDEVNDVMSAALDSGLSVTALHNHFLFDKPHVYFMHIAGEGSVAALGNGVRAALDAMKAVRAGSPQPKDHLEGPAIPATSAIDGAKVQAAFGVKGTAKDGMYKVVIGRAATEAACGCKIGKAMGVNTWAAFAGTDDNAVVDGDFAVTEDDLQPVLKALRGGGINIVAIHHHMVGEQPRILFLHYWGRGPVATLAASVKRAVDLTKTGE
jgi:hypothetical protein